MLNREGLPQAEVWFTRLCVDFGAVSGTFCSCHHVRPRPGVSSFSHSTDQKVGTLRKDRGCHLLNWSPSLLTCGVCFPPSRPPSNTEFHGERSGGREQQLAQRARQCGLLPDHRTAWARRSVHRGSTRWRPGVGGSRQPRASYAISRPQFLVCKMGLIIPSLVRGLAIYM